MPICTYEPPRDKTNNVAVRPVKTHISLGIRPVWPESSLCAHWVAKEPSFLHADSKDSDQTGRMPRLIWVLAGRTCHFVDLSWGDSYMNFWSICIYITNGSTFLESWFTFHSNRYIWAASWQNQQNDCVLSEDSYQPGHPPSLIRVFALRSVGSEGPKLSSCGQLRLWSDWADAKADPSLCWVHRSVCWFCREMAHITLSTKFP